MLCIAIERKERPDWFSTGSGQTCSQRLLYACESSLLGEVKEINLSPVLEWTSAVYVPSERLLFLGHARVIVTPPPSHGLTETGSSLS